MLYFSARHKCLVNGPILVSSSLNLKMENIEGKPKKKNHKEKDKRTSSCKRSYRDTSVLQQISVKNNESDYI